MLNPETTIGLTTLNVADLPKLSDFYQRVIGLHIRGQTPNSVELGTETTPILRLQHIADGTFSPRSPGLFHFAIGLRDREVLADWLQNYADHNAPGWQGASDHGPSHALYMTDPEGNGIEIMMDWPREKWPREADGSSSLYTRGLDLQRLLSERSGNKWQGIPQDSYVSHIHLQVADIPKTDAFYVDVLEWDRIAELGKKALFVSAGGYHHHIGMNTWQSARQPNRTDDMYGLAEFEILYPTVAEKERITTKLDIHGVSVTDDTLRDPFNNKIRLAVA